MVKSILLRIALLFAAPLAPARLDAAPAPIAAVYLDEQTVADTTFARELSVMAEVAGYTPQFIDTATLVDTAKLLAQKPDLLILSSARTLPANSAGAIEAYLKTSGDLFAIGLPGWQSPLFQINNRWLTRAEFERTIAAQKPRHLLENFDQTGLGQWSRASDRRDPKTTCELVATDRGHALHVVIDNFTGWDTLASPRLTQPFPANHSLTCFRAKGGPRTHQLALEWTEEDGSRWIATVDLATEWRDYALPADAFKPWTPPPGRGGPGDRFNVAQAVRFVVGIAQSHTAVEGAHHEYWLDDLGTAPNPFGEASIPAQPSLPRIEAFSPGYLFFPITTPVKFWTPPDLALTDAVRELGDTSPLPALETRFALHPRPRGVGSAQRRPWRWQPLLVASASDGDHRGAVAALVVNLQAPFKGGVWQCFTPSQSDFYRRPAVRRLLQDSLRAARHGLFLAEGGSEFFTAFEGQSIRLAAQVVNFSREPQAGVTVRVTVSENEGKRIAFAREWRLDLAAGDQQPVECLWQPAAWPADGFRVGVDLIALGKVIDRFSHELHVWRPKAAPQFVEAHDGAFWWRGQPWKAHGVNYMPSSGIGLANLNLFEHWLGRGAYDPEVIERDLRRVKAMGLNAVSVFIYHQSLDAQHLLDFLRRCGELGLRVNQSLRPGTPLDFRWREMKELIEYFRLAQNDTVFAYDLAWEPSHYDEIYQRRHYTKAWNAWVLKRHGTVDAAEQAWRATAPRETNAAPQAAAQTPTLAVPPMSQLTHDGPWRNIVADYRLFLDDLLREQYAAARALVKSIDPHHPVSFRMQHAGDPTHNWDRLLPYDFYGLAGAVDLWEPEAYGRIGDWDKVKAGRFTADYARLCDPAKPVVWAEMGYSVWDMSRMAPHPEKLAFAERFYADFYRMLRDSGADGVFFWWYPGGFRFNENSDFGIINPDGTDRAITRVIRAEGARFRAAPKPPPPNHWISVERERDARGLFGIYEAVQAEYWWAIDRGQTPGLKWSRQPGSRPTN